MPLFPCEQKRTVLRVYPEPAWIRHMETEPDLGLSLLWIHTNKSLPYQTSNKRRNPPPRDYRNMVFRASLFWNILLKPSGLTREPLPIEYFICMHSLFLSELDLQDFS